MHCVVIYLGSSEQVVIPAPAGMTTCSEDPRQILPSKLGTTKASYTVALGRAERAR